VSTEPRAVPHEHVLVGHGRGSGDVVHGGAGNSPDPDRRGPRVSDERILPPAVHSCHNAPLAPAVLRDLETTFSAPVLEACRMTETAHQVASNPLPNDGPHKPGSVGIATGVEMQVTRPDGKPAFAPLRSLEATQWMALTVP
jgi:acyl-CoA synthetase (AMP-forming)/AMP-acid ligase II